MATITVNKDNFEKEVMQSNVPVLIDFFASWCGPCKMLSPTIEQISDEAKSFKVCKVNIDEETELADAFGIMSVPTIAVVKNGVMTAKTVGLKPKDAILAMLK